MSDVAFLRAGDTVTAVDAPTFPSQALVVEVFGNQVELDNGQFLAARTLERVVTGEQWLPVRGYENRYRVSSHGKVVSIRYKLSARERLLRVLAPGVYPSVALSQGSHVVQCGLNRLVAQHFLPPPTEASLTYVVPKDGDVLNLRAANLQWADPFHSTDEAVSAYLHPQGERHHASRLSTDQVAQVRQLAAQGVKHQPLAEQFGVSRPTITNIVSGRVRAKA